jgi:hypothetical protein
VVSNRGISPYLFLLYTEGLSYLLQQKENEGQLQGIRNGRRGPSISHLLFADDSIFFAKGDQRSVAALQNTLQLYCEGFGQKINHDKSTIFFGNHCDGALKDSVKDSLGVHNEALHDTYLGMPTDVGNAPVNSFRFLTDRAWARMNKCSARPLSRKGKEVFIKAVIQAIPTFIMSCFLLTVSNCTSLRKAIVDFWWGVEAGKKKMHWKSLL